MGIGNVVYAVTIVIVVEIILDAVVVKVTRPLELIDSSIVIVVFVVATWS